MLFVFEVESSCPWAFTTDSILIGCEGVSLFAVTEDGRQFALNGMARTHLDLDAIDPIWKAKGDLPDIKVNIGPWIDAGHALCR